MSKYLSGVAAVALLGAATFALPASAADRQGHATTMHQSTELSSQQGRHWHGNRHWGGRRHYVTPRYYGGPRYWGPRPYAYYDPYPYGYRYYPPGPRVSFGVGPFGFWF